MSLLERLDVDPVQWRALTRTSVRIDFGALRGSLGAAGGKRMSTSVWLTMFVYGFAGFAPAAVIVGSPDPLLGATVMTTIVAFMLMTTLLAGEGAAIIAPDDHHVLGFRPVTSRTYFAVRVACICVRTVAITMLVSVLPVLAFLFGQGFRPGMAAAALVGCLATGAAVTLALIATYGWLLRLAGPDRMMRYVAYLQLVASTITWVGMFATTSVLSRNVLTGVALTGTPWALLYPGAWFASYVNLAAGQVSAATLVATLLSVATLVAFGVSISGKLALGYAESVSRAAAVAAPQVAERSTGWLRVLNDETRAVVILVRSQLRHNMRFRMGLISMVPLTVMYMFMGSHDERLRDPFVSPGAGVGMIQMALMFVPMTLRQVLVSSDQYAAAWIFHVAPAGRSRLVLAARNIITVFFLAPYVVFLAVVFAYLFHQVTHAVVHAAMLGTLSFLVLQFTILVDPQLPFSVPANKDTQTGTRIATLIVAMIVGTALYSLLTYVAYRSWTRVGIAAVLLAIAAWVVDRATRRRVERRAASMTYHG